MTHTRRDFLIQSGQTAGALFLAQLLVGCKSKKAMPLSLQTATDAPFKMEYIRGSVGYFTERGGTIGWLLSKNGIAVVDTQFPDQSKHIIDEIKKVNTRKIDLLINTHHHGDHTAGNIAFKGLIDNHLAHENSKKNQENVAKSRGGIENTLLPVETFSNRISKKVGGETITMHYFGAGHTDGDAITHFENANVVHMGDLVFNRRFPYIDKSAGANIENWISVLDQTLLTMDTDTKYMFGHSDNGYDVLGGSEDIKAFQNYLEKLWTFGKNNAPGKTLEEFKEGITTIPGAEEWQGGGIERSLDAVFTEING